LKTLRRSGTDPFEAEFAGFHLLAQARQMADPDDLPDLLAVMIEHWWRLGPAEAAGLLRLLAAVASGGLGIPALVAADTLVGGGRADTPGPTSSGGPTSPVRSVKISTRARSVSPRSTRCGVAALRS
jgi:hypothetical protein